MKDLGFNTIAIYHSHPGGSATLSREDLLFAKKHNCFQIVIALERKDLAGEEIRVYKLLQDYAYEAELVIE